jgi:site-specific recombinase XerD
VPFSLELRKLLFRYEQVIAKALVNERRTLVFATRAGLRLSYRNCHRDIQKLCKQVGIEGQHVHPHAFRHAFACSYVRQGGDIYRLSRILGHASISTTQLYLRSMGIEHLCTGRRWPGYAHSPDTLFVVEFAAL